jgi:hypothetical protein
MNITHQVISLDGWTCDICGQPVNGQTDHDGQPLISGDSVRHLTEPDTRAWTKGYEDQLAWLQGKSRAEAGLALQAREATLSPSAYNDGGSHATRNYIERHNA